VTAFIGIDPGLKGGVAYIDRYLPVNVWRMPIVKIGTKRMVNTGVLRDWIVSCGPVDLVMLEDVNAGAVKSIMSAFAFGRGYGRVEAIIECLDRPHAYVGSHVWTKALGITRGAGKPEHIAVAERLFPALRGELTDGQADALLIAEYARRLHSGRVAA
jgi:crossover junction endodeoxyribonuclease RuvC